MIKQQFLDKYNLSEQDWEILLKFEKARQGNNYMPIFKDIEERLKKLMIQQSFYQDFLSTYITDADSELERLRRENTLLKESHLIIEERYNELLAKHEEEKERKPRERRIYSWFIKKTKNQKKRRN